MFEVEDDYYPENQPRVCVCKHCRTLGWENQDETCIWYSRSDA